jgi:hypothetical protein
VRYPLRHSRFLGASGHASTGLGLALLTIWPGGDTLGICFTDQRSMRAGGMGHDLTFSHAPLRQANSINS